jgi:hypothetical protein
MGADRHSCASNLIESNRFGEGAGGESCEEPDELVFGRGLLRERLRCRSLVFVRDRATGHVCATFVLASLLARRVRQDARCGRKP